MTQQGDVKLFQTTDEGEITVEGGVVEMSGGLETSAYLSLFGGNEDDDGLQESSATYWGNLDETEPSREYRSETQHLLQALPATPNNLKRIKAAAERDLDWFLSESVASSVVVAVSMPGVNKIKLVIDIEARGEESRFEFVENWKATA